MAFVLFPLPVVFTAVTVMIFALPVSFIELEIAGVVFIAGVLDRAITFYSTFIELAYVDELTS